MARLVLHVTRLSTGCTDFALDDTAWRVLANGRKWRAGVSLKRSSELTRNNIYIKYQRRWF